MKAALIPDPTARTDIAAVDAALAALQAQVDALGGGGLTEAQVDDRIEVGVQDWAEAGNNSNIPPGKLPASTAGQSGIASGVANNEIDSEAGTTRLTWAVNHVFRAIHRVVPTWARTGNTDLIPTAKLPPSMTGGLDQSAVDARVRAGVLDFAETGDTSNVPAAKLPDATAGDKGAVRAVTDALVDTEAGTSVLGWSINHVKRLVFRIIPSWAHAGNTDQIPANKLPPSMGGGGFTLFSGSAQPQDAMGEDMDWYIQTTNGQFWQKAGGAWLLRYTDQLGQAGGGHHRDSGAGADSGLGRDGKHGQRTIRQAPFVYCYRSWGRSGSHQTRRLTPRRATAALRGLSRMSGG